MTRRPFILSALVIVLSAATLQPGAAQDPTARQGAVPETAMWGGDAAHTGRQAGPFPAGAPTVLWSAPLAGPLVATPVVADGLVYVADATGTLMAMDALDGYPRWQFAGNGAMSASVAVAKGVVYGGTTTGELDALDAVTGAARWRVPLGGSITAAPVVVDGVVYVGNGNGALSAVDIATGKERWRFQADASIASAPATANGVVFVVSADGLLSAVDAATRLARWQVQTGATSGAAPAIADGAVFIGTDGGQVLTLDAKNGRARWRAAVGSPVASTPAVANGLVFVLGANDDLHALSSADGREQWRFQAVEGSPPLPSGAASRARSDSSPSVAGGVVTFGSLAGNVYAVDAATGKERWRMATDGPVAATPAIAGGMVYASVAAAVGDSLQAIGGTGTDETPATIPLVFPPPALPAADRRLLAEDVWQLVRQIYLYPDYRGVNWNALLAEYEPRILAAPTTEAVYALVSEFVGRLNNPHCYVVPPWAVREEAGVDAGNGTYAGIGLITSYEPNALLVAAVFPGSAAAQAGLAMRDRIVAVDGTPVSAAAAGVTLDPRLPYSFALDGQSTVPGNWATHDPLGLRGPSGSAVRLTVQSPGGAPRDLTLTRRLVTTRIEAEGHRLAAAPEIGYLRIPAFFVLDMAAQVEARLRELLQNPRPLRGLVIDIRGNPGGFGSVSDPILGQFVSGRVGQTIDRAGSVAPVTVPASDLAAQLAKVPVIVLVDGGSISAAEWFAGILQSQGRARVIGMRTPGVVEDIALYSGLGGLSMAVPIKSFVLATGVNMEGQGVVPDVAVNVDWTRFDEAHDPQILQAIALLRSGRHRKSVRQRGQRWF